MLIDCIHMRSSGVFNFYSICQVFSIHIISSDYTLYINIIVLYSHHIESSTQVMFICCLQLHNNTIFLHNNILYQNLLSILRIEVIIIAISFSYDSNEKQHCNQGQNNKKWRAVRMRTTLQIIDDTTHYYLSHQ